MGHSELAEAELGEEETKCGWCMWVVYFVTGHIEGGGQCMPLSGHWLGWPPFLFSGWAGWI